MQIFLSTGKKHKFEHRIEKEFLTQCEELAKTCGMPFFEMSWPNRKIFKVFRDSKDNEYEVIYHPLTILDIT